MRFDGLCQVRRNDSGRGLAMGHFVSLVLVMLLGTSVSAQQTSIINSKHNLSASGPGSIRATSEQQVCIFCHTPHNASPVQPLWNRNVPQNAYIVYSSTSLQAKPGQPTGSSKLCLSCHDGTIAVGSVLSRDQQINMVGGTTTLPPGHGNLGTDLSDDHPISFKYDAALSAQDLKIKLPADLPPAIRLDRNQEMQCTSCHDAHNDAFGKFLLMDNTNSQLCTTCHQPGVTTIASHNLCQSCHQMHTAPSAALLLKGVNASEACLTCHSSQVTALQGLNIAADMNKVSRHYIAPLGPAPNPQSGTGAAAAQTAAITCAGCHEPHTMLTGTSIVPVVSPTLGQISGMSTAGAATPRAQYGFEVCFKCHAEQNTVQAVVSRKIVQTNMRLQFSPSAISYHPVVAAGKNLDVPSLVPEMTTGSLIACEDCHASDTSKAAGGTGPNGPHGSIYKPLLIAAYTTTDNTPESAIAYALCYRCHQRSVILSSPTFPQHQSHIVTDGTPCSVCHDAHGISSVQATAMTNSKLINFDTTVVTPDPVTGKLEYDNLGPRSGQCFLSCHGVAHSPLAYPSGFAPLGRPAIRRGIAPSRIPTPPAPRQRPVAPPPTRPPRTF